MMTLRQFSNKPDSIPTITGWYLSELGEAKGKQELFTKQTPQRLKVLREHALIESAVSSNRIEGITVDESRVRTILLGKSHLRNREEEEVRGYRNALNLIHEQGMKLAVSESTILNLHKLTRGEIGDAGCYKDKDSDIIERYPDGKTRVRFRTVPACMTSSYMNELTDLWNYSLKERCVHPLLLIAGFNLDFLCIHPFRDGNGRVSRLLLLLQLYHIGYEVGRYISIERIIEQNKDRYYETLEQSSQGWHAGKHNPWYYINYILFIIKSAYKEFEERIGHLKGPRGAKTDMIITAINSFLKDFTLLQLERVCPGVSRDMIRLVLKELRWMKKVECIGRGPGALWRKKGNTLKRG